VEELQDEPFALVGVNSDDPGRARQAVERNRLNWRSFQNQPAGASTPISDEWGVKGWPTIVVIDKEGKIHYRGHDGHIAGNVAKELLGKQ